MTHWQPGDVALCVDDRYRAYDGSAPLSAGERYTVVGVGLGYDGSLALLLLEAKNDIWLVGGRPVRKQDVGFYARRFIKQPSLVTETEEKREVTA